MPSFLADEPSVERLPQGGATGFEITYSPIDADGPMMFISQYTDLPATDAARRPAWLEETPRSAGAIWECGGSSFVAVLSWERPPEETVYQAALDEALDALSGICD